MEAERVRRIELFGISEELEGKTMDNQKIPIEAASNEKGIVDEMRAELINIAASLARFQHSELSELEQRDFGDYARRIKKVADAISKVTRCKDRNEQIAKVRSALSSVVEQDAIQPWLWTKNDVFGCRPIDMIGTHREHEIYRMIERLESGDPA